MDSAPSVKGRISPRVVLSGLELLSSPAAIPVISTGVHIDRSQVIRACGVLGDTWSLGRSADRQAPDIPL